MAITTGKQVATRVRVPKLLASCAAAALLAGLPVGAIAQDAIEITAGGEIALPAIVVEARRREERLVDVPVSATVVDQQVLEEERVETTEDLARRTPNFALPSFGDNNRSAQPIIRGIGALVSVLSPDNSTVPVIVDGVPLPAFAAAGELFDLQQVEVLRGPQGTAFGRNSTGGAVIITTAKPDAETERRFGLELGTEEFRRVQAMASGQIAQDVFGRVALSYRGQGAYLNNDQPGAGDIGAFDVGAARGTLRFTPTGTTEVVVSGNYEHDDRDTGSVVQLRDSDVYQDQPSFERTLGGLTANVTHETDRFAFHSVTGFQYYDASFTSDLTDGYLFQAITGFPPFFFAGDGEASVDGETERQVYQEFRLTSNEESRIGWATGIVGSYNDFDGDYSVRSQTFVTANGDRTINLKTQSYGIFGDLSIPVENWEFGLGARYTHEIKEIDATYIGTGLPGTVNFFSQSDRETYDLFSGRASVGYKPSENSLIYASYNRGQKAGGFSRSTNNAAIGVPETAFPETTVDAYEIGAKGSFMDDRLAVAIAGFWNDIDDEALITLDPTTFRFVVDSLDLRTRGLELEGSVLLGGGFTFNLGVGYTDGEITGVPPGSGSGAQVGNKIPNVPEYTVSTSLDYRSAPGILGMGRGEEIAGFIAYRYLAPRPVDPANTFDLDAQHIIDARLGITVDNLEFYIFGENLLDEPLEQQGSAIAPTVESVLTSRGATIGLGLTANF